MIVQPFLRSPAWGCSRASFYWAYYGKLVLPPRRFLPSPYFSSSYQGLDDLPAGSFRARLLQYQCCVSPLPVNCFLPVALPAALPRARPGAVPRLTTFSLQLLLPLAVVDAFHDHTGPFQLYPFISDSGLDIVQGE